MSSVGQSTIQAFTRFGLGARPDDPIPPDPQAWLLGQLNGPDPALTAGLPPLSACMALLAAFNATAVGTPDRATAQNAVIQRYQADAQAALANAVLTRAPFRERLVWFWSNHLAIQTNSVATSATAGSFVRDVIRPGVTGTFADMLVAMVQHPAMLFSLNNNVSVGPGSSAAVHARAAGLAFAQSANINENLGRELLELHTVGVDAGYRQADVDAMAYLLTGFTVNARSAPLGFVYNPGIAQPGSQTLMGSTFPNTQAGCIAAVRWLATRPATYMRLAGKLVTHFVADVPDGASVQAVYNALASTGGNLGAAAQALVGLPAAWRPFGKLRTPQDLVIATLRGLGVTAATMPTILPMLSAMGQATWQPPFPNGWSDLAVDWMGPEACLTRADWANTIAASGLATAPGIDAAGVAGWTLGPLLTPASRATIASASAPNDRMTLLLCSPEFQRR